MESDDEINNNNDDCLTDAFITIYENSLWFIKFFFITLWQILLFTKEELHDNQNEIINSRDILSMNNSADENYPKKIYRKLPRHHSSMIQTTNKQLSKSNSQHIRQKNSSKVNLSLNKTRVTIRSVSNQNLNHAPSMKEKLGTINSHITVAPVDPSRCQQIALKQSENVNLREQLVDILCRRSYEPLTFVNRGMCCGHCRPLFFPNVPFYHSGHYLPSSTPQQEFNQEKECSQKSEQSPLINEGTETQSTQDSVFLNIQSQSIDSPVDEPLTTDTTSNNEITPNEQNHSILSLSEHDTSQSHESEKLINDDRRLELNARILVDDSIQNAQEKYQKILQMNTNQDLQNNALTTVKQILKTQSKSASLSNESHISKLSDNPRLCQELCNKLNLSDSNQITEIMGVLASNVPHVLKEQPSTVTPPINNPIINKENNNTSCSQLLLHPPFKPKRLINLCPDGSIQVLSAVDDKSNGNQQQYQLNYSNSALIPSIQHINESSLALVNVETNFNHMLITESNSTQQSQSTNFDHCIIDKNSILSLQYENQLTFTKDIQCSNNHYHSKTISHDNNPIVKINLDLNDETTDEKNEDDENSLPEIVFKRIIAPECSILPENDNNIRRRYYHKSRHNRSQYKKAIKIET